MNSRRRTTTLVATTLALLAALAPPIHAASAATRVAAASEFVTAEQETYVDPSRSTPANGTYKGAASRTITVRFMVPAGQGPFPLVVWSHGSGTPASLAEPLAFALASKGYLVAAPGYPLSIGGAPGGATGDDRTRQPGDLSFVLTKVLAGSESSQGWLRGLVDPSRIGVAGESLGGYTTLGVLSPSGLDRRIKAAVVHAPAVFPKFPMAAPTDNPPMLYIHGQLDNDVPMATTEDFYAKSKPPKYFATVRGGSHFQMIDPAQGRQPAIFATMAAFFDVYLKGDQTGLLRLERIGSAGVVSLRGVVPCGERGPWGRSPRTRC